MMMNGIVLRAAMAGAVMVAGCDSGTSETTMNRNEPASTFGEVAPDRWRELAEKRLFFGHQSVGGNLILGVQEVLARNPQIPLTVIETADPSRMTAPGLYHARVGRNGAPESKLDAFNSIVVEAVADSGTAMLKYCYADITKDTDPAALFAQYRSAVDALQAAHQGLTIVHVTLPLTADRGTLYHLAAVVRGKTTHRQMNLVRKQYNEMLRSTYGGNEPIFDLASLESIGSDGAEANVRYRGEEVPVLATQWTYDGGHLNEAGRQRLAEAFLVTLAQL